MANHW